MSVIQDALKRRLAEQQQGKIARSARPAGGAAPPPTPPIAEQVLRNDDAARPRPVSPQPAPVEGVMVHPGGGVGKWIFGTALVMLFAVLVVGVLLYLNRGVPLVAVPPPQPPLSASQAGSTMQPQPSGTPSEPVALAPPATTPAMGTQQAAALVASAPFPTRAVASPAPSSSFSRSQWPAIRVDGVMAGAEPKKRSAILNGEMIFLNQRIEGVRLVDVAEGGVRLRYQGTEIDLEIGQVANDADD